MARLRKGRPLNLEGGDPSSEFGVTASTVANPDYGWCVAMRGDEPFQAYQEMGSPKRFGLEEKPAKSLARQIFEVAKDIFQKR